MKWVQYILFLLLTVVGRQTAAAQLRFAPDHHDFGTIREVDGQVHCTFVGVNTSKKPVVILQVVTSCGCTVPEFSKKPILPGDSTLIHVSFDPTGRSGFFTKELGIFTADRKKIAALKISGEIVARPKRIDEIYPVDAGQGLRLTDTGGAYAYVFPAKPEACVIEMVNTSNRHLRIDCIPTTQSGFVHIEGARTLEPNEEATLTFFCEIPAEKPYYGRFIDEWKLLIDGKPTSITLSTNGIGADDPALLPPERAPKAQTSVGEIRFGSVKRGQGVVQSEFTLSNKGKGELIIRKVAPQGVTTSLKEGEKIAPGRSLRVVVTLDPARFDYGFAAGKLTFITNDPAHPMRWLHVLATIEK